MARNKCILFGKVEHISLVALSSFPKEMISAKKIANSASKQREYSLEEFNKRNIYDDDDDDEILV